MSYISDLMSSGETIQLVTRQHWVTLLRSLLANGLLIILLVLLAGVGAGMDASWGSGVSIVAAMAIALPLVMLGRDLLQWSNRQFVVTTRRVIEVEGVLNKHISDSNLDKVNDLVIRQSVFGRMLGYGDVDIITGSDVGLNRLDRISRPMTFQRTILDNKEDLDTLARIRDDSTSSGPEAAAAIERLASLRKRGLISTEEFEAKKTELLARI